MRTESKLLEELTILDQSLAEVGRKVKIISVLSWGKDLEEKFLKSWRSGNPEIPKPEYPKNERPEIKSKLEEIKRKATMDHPVGNYVRRTAESYLKAARMLDSVGTPQFTELSREIYGSPEDPLSPRQISSLEAAQYFVSTMKDLFQAYRFDEAEFCIPGSTVAKALTVELDKVFTEDKVVVVLDDSLTAKAVAGPKRIRIRDATCFSTSDIPQLLYHEGFVHTLTALNGTHQPNLPTLALGAPRTTATQEGLATFAELITNSIDLSRFERISLRIQAIHMALDGANFIEVFKFFHQMGQDEKESFQSTARIFRGGNPNGKIVFTKDTVYLRGLFQVHSFLSRAIKANKFSSAENLFSGRFSLRDVVELDDYFKSGFIHPPHYEPQWLKNRRCFAAFLAFTLFTDRLNLSDIELDDYSR